MRKGKVKMKSVKNKFYKTSNALIFSLLALLGFASSCDKGSKAEYGTPSAKFIVNGNVNAKESNTPIENIRVIMNRDTSFTDGEGHYQVIEDFSFPTNQTFQINFQDTDGVVNGEYQNLDTIVEFVNPQFVNGDGNWYAGETSKKLNVKLDKK
jgi:putative lipoprotein (rSAM/lipoprotein system)